MTPRTPAKDLAVSLGDAPAKTAISHRTPAASVKQAKLRELVACVKTLMYRYYDGFAKTRSGQYTEGMMSLLNPVRLLVPVWQARIFA
jgi:hypothetical protein